MASHSWALFCPTPQLPDMQRSVDLANPARRQALYA